MDPLKALLAKKKPVAKIQETTIVAKPKDAQEAMGNEPNAPLFGPKGGNPSIFGSDEEDNMQMPQSIELNVDGQKMDNLDDIIQYVLDLVEKREQGEGTESNEPTQ